MPTNTSTSRLHRPPRVHVEVCFDPDDDLELTRGAHARCRPGSGRIALTPGPDTGTEVQLMLHLLYALSVLWRIPGRLHSGRAMIAGDDLAAVRWEISWACTVAASPSCGCSVPSTWVISVGCGCAKSPRTSSCAWSCSPVAVRPLRARSRRCAAVVGMT